MNAQTSIKIWMLYFYLLCVLHDYFIKEAAILILQYTWHIQESLNTQLHIQWQIPLKHTCIIHMAINWKMLLICGKTRQRTQFKIHSCTYISAEGNAVLINFDNLQYVTHTRMGFIFRRIKSLFHHSNWQHIFLISFNGTSKRGVMHYKYLKKIYMIFFLVKHCQFAWAIVDFQSLKTLPIWRFLDNFSLEKILRSTRTLDCDKYRLKLKGRFFSFCWAIFLYFSTPISWVMIRNVINPTFLWTFALCMESTNCSYQSGCVSEWGSVCVSEWDSVCDCVYYVLVRGDNRGHPWVLLQATGRHTFYTEHIYACLFRVWFKQCKRHSLSLA